MGSVKDLEIKDPPKKDSTGLGVFHFSDRYSILDWGEMPENIDKKGESLALMGAYTFEMLEERGINTHYKGVKEEGELKTIDELESPTNRMVIELVNVLEPEFREGSYDYSVFSDRSVNNYLLPLEVIFRNTIPVGSSIRRRYSPGDLGLGFDKWPDDQVSLNEPIVEASTKLEEQDRHIEDEEAERIAGVSSLKIFNLAGSVNEIITERARNIGFTHDDGKIEILYIDGNIVVGDVAGTFDENRFTFNEMPVSKEVLRQAYKKRQKKWVREVMEAKKKAKKGGIKEWKKLVDTRPESLGIENLVSEMYQAGANRYVGRSFFDVRDLEEIVKDLKSIF